MATVPITRNSGTAGENQVRRMFPQATKIKYVSKPVPIEGVSAR